MPWWAWVVLAWGAIGLSAAGLLARALGLSDRLDWTRRGRPDRRSSDRAASPGQRDRSPD